MYHTKMGEGPFFHRRRGQGDETNVERCMLVPTKLSNNDPRNHFRRSYVSDSEVTFVWDQKNSASVARRSTILIFPVAFYCF